MLRVSLRMSRAISVQMTSDLVTYPRRSALSLPLRLALSEHVLGVFIKYGWAHPWIVQAFMANPLSTQLPKGEL